MSRLLGGRARGRVPASAPIAAATVVLLALSPLLAHRSLSAGALATTLPFAAVLCVAAVGQTLVVQQGGLDFSVPGSMTLSAVLLSELTGDHPQRLGLAVLAVLAVGLIVGLANGLLVTWLRITPLIATLGMNALLLGAVQQLTGGGSLLPVPASLNRVALGKTVGVFNLVLVALVLVAVVALLTKSTTSGRRFEVSGAAPAAARVAGLSVAGYRNAAYALAGLCYAGAGVMLTGFLSVPNLDVGNPYLLSTIAAVVVGGTALGGGVGSAVATGLGALFLTQLTQLLYAIGAKSSTNYIVQGAVIGVTMGLRAAAGRWSTRRAAAASLGDADSNTPTAGGRHDQPDSATTSAIAADRSGTGGSAPVRQAQVSARPSLTIAKGRP